MYQNNNPYGVQQNYGFTYGVPAPQARRTQPLTPEQIAKLRQNDNRFDMKVEVEDLWRAACTHKEKNGQSSLIDNGNGTYRCTICGEEFKMYDSSVEEIQNAVDSIINMLQTCKTIYLDAPEQLITEYMQIIPLLKKFPSLWKHAMDNFSKYDDITSGVNPISPNYASGFATLQNLMTNPYAAYQAQPNMYGQQMPMQQYGYQQPVYNQQPPVGYNATVNPSVNPMAYGMPSTVPAPTAPAPGVMPAGAAQVPTQVPAQQTEQPAPVQAEVQQQQVFNV